MGAIKDKMGKLNWQNQFDMHQESLKNSTDGTIVVQIILRSKTYPWAPGFRVWLEKYYTGVGILCVFTACSNHRSRVFGLAKKNCWVWPTCKDQSKKPYASERLVIFISWVGAVLVLALRDLFRTRQDGKSRLGLVLNTSKTQRMSRAQKWNPSTLPVAPFWGHASNRSRGVSLRAAPDNRWGWRPSWSAPEPYPSDTTISRATWSQQNLRISQDYSIVIGFVQPQVWTTGSTQKISSSHWLDRGLQVRFKQTKFGIQINS